MVNQQILEGHWSELTGHIKQRWGQLTDDDLQAVEGNAEQLVGLIERKTGETREHVENSLEEIVAQGASSEAEAAAAIRARAEQVKQHVQQGYDQASEAVKQHYGDAEEVVKQRPLESIAVAFGSGLIAGLIVGLVVRSR